MASTRADLRERPKVIANFAMTWDGRISTRSGTPSDFSSKADKARLIEIRAMGDAVLVGRRTAEIDDTSLGISDEALQAQRLATGKPAHPIRVIFSQFGHIAPELKVFQRKISPVLIYATEQMSAHDREALSGLATLHVQPAPELDVRTALCHLRQEHAVRTVVCEGGGALLHSLLTSDCVDELYLTLCPRIFGGESAPTITGIAGKFLPKTVECGLREMRIVEDECFLRYRVRRSKKTANA